MTVRLTNPTRRHVLICAGGVVLAGFGATHSMGLTTTLMLPCPHRRPVDRRYFGMHIHGIAVRRPWVPYGEYMTPWPSIDFGTWRLWDAYVAWPNLQPWKNWWDFSILDRYLDIADEHKVEVLLPLGLSPPWASARPDEKSPYKPGNAAEPANVEDWRNYVRTVAKRYKGRIQNYEFWNEPNLKGQTVFYTGSVSQAVTLTREAYQILKDVDPDNTLAGPAGTGGGKELQWLDDYLRLGAGDYLDKLSYHFYVASSRPESMVPYVGRVRAIADKYGLGHLPLVNSETGWVIANTQSPPSRIGVDSSWTTLSPELGAAYVARSLILGWALGLEEYHWYSWDHSSMGLIEPATKEIKPAGRAYAKTVEWLLGATMTGCEADQGVWVCTLRDASGNVFHIVWREAGNPAPWLVPTAWRANEVESQDGSRSKIFGGKVSIGPVPVLITTSRGTR